MVFSNLQAPEKEAFFSLLDEYFQSRPEIFANLSHGTPTVSPAAVSAASKMVSTGLRHAASNNASRPNAGGGTTSSESEISSVADRVAAFALQRNSHPAPSTNNVSSASAFKKIGDIDTSSAKNFFGSLRNTNNSNSASPPPPTQQQSNFGAPPVRRVVSNASPRVVAPDPTAPPPRPQEEEEKAGDWADVIYDYDSGEAGDLKITEGDVVLIIDRSSDDWWTGEVNGKKGLFPASYVNLR